MAIIQTKYGARKGNGTMQRGINYNPDGSIPGYGGNAPSHGGSAACCPPCASGGGPQSCEKRFVGGDASPNDPFLPTRSYFEECGRVLIKTIPDVYTQRRSTFASAWMVAKSQASANPLSAANNVTSPGVVSTFLQTVSGQQTALGIQVRVSVLAQGANPTFRLRTLLDLGPYGAYDSQDLVCQLDNTSGVFVLNLFPWSLTNTVEPNYHPLLISAAPATTSEVRITGLPVGATIFVRSLQTNEPENQAISEAAT